MVAAGDELKLEGGTWIVSGELKRGGFGVVYLVTDADGIEAAAKLVPKDPGAQRELLLGTAMKAARYRRVIPVLDHGEHDNSLVLVMPRAEKSLADHIQGRLPLSLSETVEILSDVAEALSEIDGEIVHRDLKPANVLRFQGSWLLADFGIARYAEATTAPDTQKFALSPPYAAPEQWRAQRATSATDVYALGVMGYLMLSGMLPFPGPSYDDFRAQHLEEAPPPLTAGTTRARDLIEECLVKAPQARPTPGAVLRRLARISQEPTSSGFKKLAEVHQEEIERRSEALRQASIEQERQESRLLLHQSAAALLESVANRVREAIEDHAPAADISLDEGGGKMFFVASLRGAKLGMSRPILSDATWTTPFTVVSEAVITVNPVQSVRGYAGRTHSLWYCDAFEEGRFAWYELAFMEFAMNNQPARVPFAMGAASARQAFLPIVGTTQLARRFEELDRSELDDFLDRWLGWFARAIAGELQAPGVLPEHQPVDNWRQR